jgi:hypothetical protein
LGLDMHLLIREIKRRRFVETAASLGIVIAFCLALGTLLVIQGFLMSSWLLLLALVCFGVALICSAGLIGLLKEAKRKPPLDCRQVKRLGRGTGSFQR